LNVTEITEKGLLGDRVYALRDPSDGKIATAKNPRKWPSLFDYRAALVNDRIPVHHDLAVWLNEYIAAAGIAEEPKAPLFGAAAGKRKVLTTSAYRAHSMRQMMKRRLEDAGLPDLFSPHSFRVTVVTDLLNQNVPLEDVQYLAGRASPTTTRVYDRRRRKLTRNIVERISI
jgi:integrase/recombinase XerD